MLTNPSDPISFLVHSWPAALHLEVFSMFTTAAISPVHSCKATSELASSVLSPVALEAWGGRGGGERGCDQPG